MRSPSASSGSQDPAPDAPWIHRTRSVLSLAFAAVAALLDVVPLRLLLGGAGGLGLDVLGQLLAVLGVDFDRRDRRGAAEALGVCQVALSAAEEGEAEVADRDVGDDRDRVFRRRR